MLTPFRVIVAVLAMAGLSACLAAGESADPVLAVIGQTEIHASQVDRGMPSGLFGSARKNVRSQRLARLIDEAAYRQAIVTAGVTVDEQAIDAAFAEVSKQAPTPPCSCYSYRDYDDYLAQNLMTREEARAELWIERGLDLVVDREWTRAHPDPAALAALVQAEGPAVRAKLRRYWHIGCWSSTNDEPANNPAKRGPVWDKVLAARSRIQAGADFATVAQEVDEDPKEAKRGGFAGILALEQASILGVEATVLADLPPQVVSEPLPGLWSFHLIRWEPLTDTDVIDHLKAQFVDQQRFAFVNRVTAAKRVEYRGDGKALAPAADRP